MHVTNSCSSNDSDASFYLSLMRAYLDSTNDGIFVVCDECKFHVANRVMQSWLGESEASLTAHNARVPITEFLGSEAAAELFDAQFRQALGGKANQFECFIQPPAGRARWVDISMSKVDVEGADLIIGVVRDITEQKARQMQMEHLAVHDDLTGFVNRREFIERLTALIDIARSDQSEHALLYLDLDQFKVVNDTCGHTAGDELLRQLSAAIQRKVRSSDMVGRLGGDEFAVLLRSCSPLKAMEVAESIRNEIAVHRFSWESRVFELGASIGMVVIDAAAPDAKTLLSMADAACYVAKDKGRNRVQFFFDGEECAHRRSEMEWVTRISSALAEDRFCLYHQNIAEASAPSTCQSHKEILVRMVDQEGRIILPGQFMPAAEKYNLMSAIDRWVIRKLFSGKAQEWDGFNAKCAQRGMTCNAFSAINLSGASLNDDTFFDFLRDEIKRHRVPPSAVCFEITETVAIHNLRRVADFIAELKAMGFRFALDDFGSGVSSFSYLKALPVDFLKIDGALVREIEHSMLDLRIVESIALIGQEMGAKIIAEFVETAGVLERLRDIGVDYAQGYGIHRPEPLK